MRVGKLSGAVGQYAAIDPEVERIACERLGLEPAPASTQIVQRDRHAELLAALAVCASSLDKFALEIRHLARTEVREVEEPFGKGQKGSSAMPHKRNPVVAERICGLARVVRAAALVGLENVALWHERDISHSSAERVVIPDAFLALDYMLDRFTWLMDGLVVHPERMRRNLDSSHGLYFSQRLLLALVESGLERDEAYGLVQRNAMRAWEEERDFRELVRRRSRHSSRPRRGLRRERIHQARRRRLRSSPQPRKGARACLRAHLASGKVREIYALDDERLLLVASDRISTFDVVLPTEIPDKGRVLTGLSGFWFARTKHVVPNHLLALRDDGRSTECRRLEMLPVECVVRGYITGSGWKDYLATGEVCGHRFPRACRSRSACPSRSSRPRRRRRPATTRTSRGTRRPSSSARERFDEVERIALDLYRFAAAHAEKRGIILADTKFELGVDEAGTLVLADEAFTPDSSRFWPADRYAPGGPQPSFDKQYVRDYCESVGWDKTYPGPELPEHVVVETRAQIRRGVHAPDRHLLRRLPRRSGGRPAMKATVLVRPKEGILDPQGQAVEQSLRKLGFAVEHARVGRVVDVDVDASSATKRASESTRCASSCSRTR